MNRYRHRRYERIVSAFVDGELPVGVAASVAAHIDDCWDCSAVAATVRLMKHSIRTMARREPPELATARLRRYAEGLVRS